MNKDFIIISVGRALQIVVGILSIRVATHYLSPEQMGFYAIILAIVSYSSLCFANPVGQYMSRRVNEWRDLGSLKSRLVLFGIYAVLVSGFSCIVVYVIGLNQMILPGMEPLHLACVVAALFLSQSLCMTFLNLLNILGDQVSYISLSVLTAIGGLLLSAIFVANNNEAIFWVFGQSVAFLLVVPLAFAFVIKLNQSSKPEFFKTQDLPQMFGRVWRYAFPLAMATFFMWFLNDSFRFIVEQRAGLEYLGYFSVGFMISQKIGSTVETIVTQLFCPKFFKSLVGADTEQRQRAWQLLFRESAPVYLLTAIFTTGCAPFLVAILASPQYAEAWMFIVLTAWMQFFKSLGNIYSTIAHSEMATKKLILPYLGGGIISLTGVYVAAGMEQFSWLVPVALIMAQMACFAGLVLSLKSLLVTKIPFKEFGLVLLGGILLLSPLLLNSWYFKLYPSLIIILCSGCYFMAVLYFIYKSNFKLRVSS